MEVLKGFNSESSNMKFVPVAELYAGAFVTNSLRFNRLQSDVAKFIMLFYSVRVPETSSCVNVITIFKDQAGQKTK